jgi:maltose alpha-D-glucosyltransferase/alpha-amylase
MWFKNAIIYSLDVETFADGNGDGIGDFEGLMQRLDYLEGLGITCLWLQPFYPTPNRDDGYDVMDYYGVDRRLGTLGDFAELAHQLSQRGIRLMIDLVANHTSDQHPWFQEGSRDPQSRYRDYYVWSEEKPANAEEGMAFPGVQESTWTWNDAAGAYYFHRFYRHQPDLNIANPEVRQEILRIMGYWAALGVSGFRVDAAPFLVEFSGSADAQREPDYAFFREMHRFLAWRRAEGAMLGEANVALEQVDRFFGDGDRLHLLFNFLVNQSLFLALARQRSEPLTRCLERLTQVPGNCQWAHFLRGHDELDLGRLTEEDRQAVFAAFGPEPQMQLYGRGIRRRLAPMFGGDLGRVEMAHSLIFSLPGTQVIRYGDEIGMGDDLSLEERNSVRTPMQWSRGANGGFSDAEPEDLIRPVIQSERYGPARVNVQDQLGDPASLLSRMQRLIALRRGCPEVGFGETVLVATDQPAVFAHLCRWEQHAVLILHNFSASPLTAGVDAAILKGRRPVPLAADRVYPPAEQEFELGPFGYRWLRLV